MTGKRCLVVLDEMFRGTNAKDAFEVSVAVNELLKSFSHCHFLISTHILEYAKVFERILPVAFIIWKQKLLMMRLSVLIGCCQGFQRPESGIGS